MIASEVKSPHDAASQLEQGSCPVSPVPSSDTFNEKLATTRSDTLLSRGTSRIAAFGSNTWTTISAAGAAIRPKTSSCKAEYKVRALEDYPQGYPRVSYFLNSDESFMMYRRFGQVHSRLLLYKQDQIRRLEAKLLRLDRMDARTDDDQLYLECQEEGEKRDGKVDGMTRASIMEDLEKKILEYGRLLAQTKELHSMNRPSDRDHKSVSNYFNNNAPLIEEDAEFLKYKEDLVSIRPGNEHAWLDDCVDTLLRWYPCRPVKYVFCDKETLAKTSDESIHYFSRPRISFFVTFIITLMVLALLIVPIWVLYHLTVQEAGTIADFECIIVLLMFTLLFSVVLSSVTKAKRHEVLAAAAGYCAVLVVFVGNIGKSGS